MSREDMLYQIYYSYCLEKMLSVITDKINWASSFLLILLGSTIAVIGGYYTVFAGLLIIAIATMQIMFSFEVTSERANKQAARYLMLYNTSHLIISDEELLNRLVDIQDNDNRPWASLVYPAMLQASQILGRPTDIQLTWYEKLMAILAGSVSVR
ncbi:hypothetical protein LGZ99_17280 [Photorhabdus temperata]|uniref:Uncharacterized protein n=1 Tax=Photorhabdus temperata subsp. temperata Meg1 TaxID=1393735 RepID=A0A081RVY2_PHOTE|nr:hypothetical protein [Photorhabdus temperata]KER02835.1 hypothetical protein MEG1DRAFT_02564 [Photorhabdus temperata subsp. temperata Meg1]MCT8348890.1 hypothetical protein [Photorhabdus temperata]